MLYKHPAHCKSLKLAKLILLVCSLARNKLHKPLIAMPFQYDSTDSTDCKWWLAKLSY